MGTRFPLVDKLVSSLGSTTVGVDEDFLLTSETAKKLYHEYAEVIRLRRQELKICRR